MANVIKHSYKVLYLAAYNSIKTDFEAHLYNKDDKIENRTLESNGDHFYINRIGRQNNIDTFCLHRIRTRGLSKKANIDNKKETDLGLGPREGLSEKAYLAYDKSTGNMVIQCNSDVCHRTRFLAIFKGILRGDYLHPVIIDRNLLSHDTVVAFDFSVAVPKEAKFEGLDIRNNVFATVIELLLGMSAGDATKKLGFKITLGRMQNKSKICDGTVIKKLLDRLAKLGIIAQGKVWVQPKEDNEGVNVPHLILDLSGATKTSSIDVLMDDEKYPNEDDIVVKLRKCLTG